MLKNKKHPRLSVYRSNKNIYAQVIDDTKGLTLASFSNLIIDEKEVSGKNKTQVAGLVGEKIAKATIDKKVKKVVFDRGMFKYHGRVKAVAEGARKGGLEF